MGDQQNDFRRATGANYFSLLKHLHTTLEPDLYLEVGSRTGNSLALAKGDFIAIDPVFNLKKFAQFQGRNAHFFQVPSDEFFAGDFLKRNKMTPDFCFLDGMHHFEFLLRDFINAEATSKPGATIALHDCCPFNGIMTRRKWVRRRTREWTGDVWKVLTILLDHRPDLDITVYDAAPTGLVAVQNTDPKNDVLSNSYDDLVTKFDGVEIEDFGVGRFFDSFEYTSTDAVLSSAA